MEPCYKAKDTGLCDLTSWVNVQCAAVGLETEPLGIKQLHSLPLFCAVD